MKTGSQRDYGPLWGRWIPARVRDRYYQARARRIEREHREEFERFYARLPNQRDVFYMFFTSGLLHWVVRAVSCVPEDVNLVLLGSDLEPEEIAWLRENLERPFHPIRLHVDDRAAWELLFATQRHNFGWIDADCFVLEPSLLAEMRTISPRAFANTAWSFKAPGGTDMLSTFCVFLNVDAIRAVSSEIAVSPDAYSHRLIRRPGSPYAFTKLLTPVHRRWLNQVLPPDRRGRPLYVNGDGYFDTLQVYQLIAHALGYAVHRVRPLTLAEQLSSEDIVHIGKVSYYRRYKDRAEPWLQRLYKLLLQAEFVLLSEMAGELPPSYVRLQRRLAADLLELGLVADAGELREALCREMVREGANASSIRQILAGRASGRRPSPEGVR